MKCVPERVVQKSEFVILMNKIQFLSNEVCYKASVCENFQWQSRSLSSGLRMFEFKVTLQPNI